MLSASCCLCTQTRPLAEAVQDLAGCPDDVVHSVAAVITDTFHRYSVGVRGGRDYADAVFIRLRQGLQRLQSPLLSACSGITGNVDNLDSVASGFTSGIHLNHQLATLQPAALDKALAANKRVFVDITANWCINCKVNEALVLNSAAVADELNRADVVALRGDWSRPSPNIEAFLQRNGVSGIPFNALFTPVNTEENICRLFLISISY